MKRFVALLLTAVLLICSTAALAEYWTCPDCGHDENKGNFCEECGSAKPVYDEPEFDESEFETDIQPGDYVHFGNYKMTRTGTDDIEWLVLDIEDGYAFLLSRYGLDRIKWNKSSNGATWETCWMRSWLNDEFLYNAFTSSERYAIRTTTLENDESTSRNDWNTTGRNSGTTEDKIFLLSYQELSEYLGTNERMCIPSEYAVSQGCNRSSKGFLNGQRTCWYWLRTCAFKNNVGVVDWDGSLATCYMHHSYGVVRPALWVEVSALDPD